MATGAGTKDEMGGLDKSDLMLATVLERWPSCAQVFWQRKMQCPGCPFAPFHTIQDACREYGLDEAEFRADLKTVAPVKPD